MNLPANNRRVFIIRIWCEPREIEGALPEWRGIIESTHDKQRRYLKNFDEIITFILPYLEKLGVKLETEWLERQKSSLSEPDGNVATES